LFTVRWLAKGEIEMKGMVWLRLGLLAAFAVLFNACQLPGAPPAHGQGLASPLPVPAQGQPQSPLAYTEPASPLLVDADSPDCVGVAGLEGYQMVQRTAIQPRPVDGVIQPYSLRPAITELLFFVTRTDDQVCNVYRATVTVDPQTGARNVTDQSYAVDDLFFSYCTLCAPPYHSGVWVVDKRTPGEDPNYFPLGLTPTAVGPIAVAQLAAQSSVVGDEAMNGFATVHRRFTDRQMLSEAVRWQLGGAARDPLEVTTAQVDMWLTRDTHRLVRLRFQAEGKAPGITDAGVLYPFALTDEFNFTAVDRNTPIVVPDEVLAAVAAQRKALEGE